jgi:hypothetical protein
MQDVERISFGKPAKQKGTGSRGVPHRLNQDERNLFDMARNKGYLEVFGSAWRSQRREAPLLNTYRGYCDAKAQPCIVVHKSNNGMEDRVVVDLSPLRFPSDFGQVARDCIQRVSVDVSVVPEIVHDERFDPSLVLEQEHEEDNSPAEKEDPWASRPIYQLPPFCVVWTLPRPQAKFLGNLLASPTLFGTASLEKKARSKKSMVKPGKSRRHGGYGIG